jgi:GAF domain-containing protein
MTDDTLLSRTGSESALADLARIVLSNETLETVLDRVAFAAKRSMAIDVEASVTVLGDDGARTAAATGQLAVVLDDSQYTNNSGPCLDAANDGTVHHITDVRTETRWPAFTAAAIERGARSSLSVPLQVQQRVVGALNIYGHHPDVFDEESVRIAEGFASYAAVAVANAQLYTSTAALAHHMEQAMRSRAVIEQAKGILMALHGLDADAAFGLLTQQSQRSHRKLRDVAQAIVEAGARRPL